MFVVDVQDVTIARFYQQPHDTWSALDNAKLAAAAPDMYDALQSLLKLTRKGSTDFSSWHGATAEDIGATLAEVRAAVNKVKEPG